MDFWEISPYFQPSFNEAHLNRMREVEENYMFQKHACLMFDFWKIVNLFKRKRNNLSFKTQIFKYIKFLIF